MAAMLVAGSLTLTGCGAKTIDLNTFLVDYDVDGYNGYGTVRTTFDTEALEAEIEKALGKNENSGADVLEKYYAVEAAATSGSWDKANNLKNGDTITYSWNMDADAISKNYGVNLKWEPVTEEVSGLEEMETFDPFENLEIEVEGIAPNGTITLDPDDESDLYFTVSEDSGLSVGDTVTIYLETPTDECIAMYSKVPERTSMEYTVEGLDGYMTDVSQITEDLDNQIRSQLDDIIVSAYATNEEANAENYEVLGYYLLTNKDSNTYSLINQLYLVYKIDVHHKDDNVEEVVTAYRYVRFENAMVYADGTAYVDLMNYSIPEYSWGIGEGFKSASGQTYLGYSDFDKLYNQCINSQKASYNVSTTIDDQNNDQSDDQAETLAEEHSETESETENK